MLKFCLRFVPVIKKRSESSVFYRVSKNLNMCENKAPSDEGAV